MFLYFPFLHSSRANLPSWTFIISYQSSSIYEAGPPVFWTSRAWVTRWRAQPLSAVNKWSDSISARCEYWRKRHWMSCDSHINNSERPVCADTLSDSPEIIELVPEAEEKPSLWYCVLIIEKWTSLECHVKQHSDGGFRLRRCRRFFLSSYTRGKFIM